MRKVEISILEPRGMQVIHICVAIVPDYVFDVESFHQFFSAGDESRKMSRFLYPFHREGAFDISQIFQRANVIDDMAIKLDGNILVIKVRYTRINHHRRNSIIDGKFICKGRL